MTLHLVRPAVWWQTLDASQPGEESGLTGPANKTTLEVFVRSDLNCPALMQLVPELRTSCARIEELR
jgi:hypothetical protein